MNSWRLSSVSGEHFFLSFRLFFVQLLPLQPCDISHQGVTGIRETKWLSDKHLSFCFHFHHGESSRDVTGHLILANSSSFPSLHTRNWTVSHFNDRTLETIFMPSLSICQLPWTSLNSTSLSLHPPPPQFSVTINRIPKVVGALVDIVKTNVGSSCCGISGEGKERGRRREWNDDVE